MGLALTLRSFSTGTSMHFKLHTWKVHEQPYFRNVYVKLHCQLFTGYEAMESFRQDIYVFPERSVWEMHNRAPARGGTAFRENFE